MVAFVNSSTRLLRKHLTYHNASLQTVTNLGQYVKSSSLRLFHSPFLKAFQQLRPQLRHPIIKSLDSEPHLTLDAKCVPAIPVPTPLSPERNTFNQHTNSSLKNPSSPPLSMLSSLFQPKQWISNLTRCFIQCLPMANSVASKESPNLLSYQIPPLQPPKTVIATSNNGLFIQGLLSPIGNYYIVPVFTIHHPIPKSRQPYSRLHSYRQYFQLEDSHRQDRDKYTNAANTNNDAASFESEPKGQQVVDIQALANNMEQSEFIVASDSEDEVPSSQPSEAHPTAPPTNQANPPESATDDAPMAPTANTHTANAQVWLNGVNQGAPTASPQGFDLTSLMNQIASTIQLRHKA